MPASSICFDRGEWVHFADVEGNPHSGAILSGGVVGDDGKRSDVTIAVADETFVVPALNVLHNVEDPQVALAQAKSLQEEQEAAAAEEAERAYAEEAAAEAEAEAIKSNEENVLSNEEKAELKEYGLTEIALAADRFKAEMAASSDDEASEAPDALEEPKAASDSGNEEQQELSPAPAPAPPQAPAAAQPAEIEAEPEADEAMSPPPEADDDSLASGDPQPAPAATPEPEASQSQSQPELTDEEVTAATVATTAAAAAGEAAHASPAPPLDFAWFDKAMVIVRDASTLTEEDKKYVANVMGVYVEMRRGGGHVDECIAATWPKLREGIKCEATWKRILEELPAPPFGVPPEPEPAEAPVEAPAAEAEPAAPAPATATAPAAPPAPPKGKAPRKKRQAKPQEPTMKKQKTEARVEPPFEPANIDEDQYEVSTVEATVKDILVASKLHDFKNYSARYSLCPDKTSDPLIDDMDGSTALQKLRAFVRKQNVESLTSHRAVCITARMLYLVMVSKNSKYTDLMSALTYIKSSQDNSPEVITFLCVRVLNKINNQNEVNSFVRLMYTMLANLAVAVL